MRRTLVTAVLAPALVVGALAAPAAADGPAQHFRFDDCIDNPQGPGSRLCIDARGVTHSTQTPSGNDVVVSNGRTRSSFMRNGVTLVESEQKTHISRLVRDGELFVEHLRFASSESTPAGTCVSTYHSAYANGEVRHVDTDVDCT